MTNLPVVGIMVYAFRALKLSYESSLVDDQSLAGDQLVGVVRSRQVFERLARKNGPWNGRSNSATQDMLAAGGYLQVLENLSDPALRAVVPGFSPLLKACVAARESAAGIGTGLHAVQPKKAAVVVASAFLNACLNEHGPGAIDIASNGIAQLARILGPKAELDAWWQAMSAQSTQLPLEPEGYEKR